MNLAESSQSVDVGQLTEADQCTGGSPQTEASQPTGAGPMAAQTICLTKMAEKHLDEVDALRQVMLGDASNKPFLLSGLRSAHQEHIVAVLASQPSAVQHATVVGYAATMHVEQDSQLLAVAVSPKQQGRGIATQMLAKLLCSAAQRGVRSCRLEVRLSNLPARELYRRFGFAPVGVRYNYYPATPVGPKEHALVMWLSDISSPEVLGRIAKVSRRRPRL